MTNQQPLQINVHLEMDHLLLVLLLLVSSDSVPSPVKVRLMNGATLCSGRVEVYDMGKQMWYSVCEANFDQHDAEVVCRELDCGPPSVIKGALYGEVEIPLWAKEFHCAGDESHLWACDSSDSIRNTCSPGRAVGLTCSEPIWLMGGTSRCGGTLELKHLGEWRPVYGPEWTRREAAVVCEHLNCGSAISVQLRKLSSRRPVWWTRPDCVQSSSSLVNCTESRSLEYILDVRCSDYVRLVNGTSLCSGRVEVKANPSNQYHRKWFSVCEADFDQQDAKVVCRELGCGPPSVLQGGLYGEVEDPLWMKEFNCAGNESVLLECKSSDSIRNTCSHGKAVGVTCSEPLRFVGGGSRCAGRLELKHLGEWRPVYDSLWTTGEAAVVCKHLDCGSVVAEKQMPLSSVISVWWMKLGCIQSRSVLKDCLMAGFSSFFVAVICSDLLFQPVISVSSSMSIVSSDHQQEFQISRGSSFAISCFIQPQYSGGSFQLSFNTLYNYTQPAFNHSAHFLFPAAEPFHQGNYSCVYHIYIFSHNFSSESHHLSLTVSESADSKSPLIRVVVLLLALLLVNTALYFYFKMTREQKTKNRKKITGCVNDL